MSDYKEMFSMSREGERERKRKRRGRRSDYKKNGARKERHDLEISELKKVGRDAVGIYIPPFKLGGMNMMKEIEDKSSLEYQRLTWEPEDQFTHEISLEDEIDPETDLGI